MLLDLPVEILQAIASQLAKKRDLKHLCETSTYLYQIAVSILYESNTIHAPDEYRLYDLDVPPLLRARVTQNNLLHRTKGIRIASQFHVRTENRCIHHDSWSPHNDRDKSVDGNEEYSPLGLQTASLMPLFDGCRDDNLRSFSWDMGTCIPSQILGPSGCLPLRQKQIHSIRLITDGACDHNLAQRTSIFLLNFTNLKELSWTGLRSKRDIRTLKSTIQQVSKQLQVLELDFGHWDLLKEALSLEEDFADEYLAEHILKLANESTIIAFPALQVLSLANISLLHGAGELNYAFNFESLSSLKILFCPGWEQFPLCNIHTSSPKKLKPLEIQSNDGDEIDAGISIPEFLKSFQGLEQLAIQTDSCSNTLNIWEA